MSNYTHEKIKPKMSKEERDKMMKRFLDEYKNTKPNTYHDYDLGGDKIPVYEPTNKKGGE